MTAVVPETHYLRTPRGHLAYQVTGDGDRWILFLSGTVSHVELRWEIPHLVRMYRRLMALGRVLTIDPLGMGASDPLPDPPPTLLEVADDCVALLEHVGAQRVSIVASLHGVPVALAAAAAHPDCVEKLVFLGGYARLWAGPDYPEGLDPAILEAFFEVYLPIWGTGQASSTIYDIQPEAHEIPLYARLERAAAAPGSVERLLRWVTNCDARADAPRVQAPALVFGIPSRLVDESATRKLVELLPEARYIEIGHDPVTTGEGLDELMAEIAEFLTGSRAASNDDRSLAAVLFVDIVGSTERAAEMGDGEWRHLLDTFRLTVRREIDRYDGREVNTRGDDFLVVFERASSAIECARAMRAAVSAMGLALRVGIHVGEVEHAGDDLTGVAVHVGARVVGLARAGEILATTAAREAVTGMAWTFIDRGAHRLKGVPGEWHLWSVDQST
jgi:class 3 adenylate cyclase